MSITLAASVPVANRRRWWTPAVAWGRSTVIVDVIVPNICRILGSSDAGRDQDAAMQSRSTQRMAGGGHAVKYFSDVSPATGQCSGQQQGSIKSPVGSDEDSTAATIGLPRKTAETKRSRCQVPTEPHQIRPPEFHVLRGKPRAMAHALFRPLFSTKTLVRVAFTALSLHSMGTAFGQGLAAGTTAPVYGTTWAAARALSHIQDAPVMASRQPKDGHADASATLRNKIHPPSRRTGG